MSSKTYFKNERFIYNYHEYQRCYWKEFDFDVLHRITSFRRQGRGSSRTYNDAIIMIDTETSKEKENTTRLEFNKKTGVFEEKYNPVRNYVCAWTISIRAYHKNICTLYGAKPSELVECVRLIQQSMPGDDTYMFIHNMSYDWWFLRRFFFDLYGFPDKQLNTKSHYPILIQWQDDGLILRDSLILAQRKLEKWADDLDVHDKKATGKWDYNKRRKQICDYNTDELEYIEHDTLAGVECLDKTFINLSKNVSSAPYTATGIPRGDVRALAKENNFRETFLKLVGNLSFQKYLESIYHGGFTHANRWYIDRPINVLVKCYDFASSYPFSLLAEKYPMEKFRKTDNLSIDEILESTNDYAFVFTLVATDVKLQDSKYPMPALQYSKCTKTVNALCDNGRIIEADYIEIPLTDVDLRVINKLYKFGKHLCVNVYFSKKDYLPRWLTDYIFKCFEDKTMLKGGDPVLYSIAKAKLNSIYGLMVQKPVKEIIEELYESGEYHKVKDDMEELYEKYINNRNSVLPYQWGVFCTAYSFYHLFELYDCIGKDGFLLYSDTDSCYAHGWDEKKIAAYNEKCKNMLRANGYGCVTRPDKPGREYWLGVAESEGKEDEYSEFRVMGAKRYAGRCLDDNQIHITVAGVPKKNGAKCLDDDLNNFRVGFNFEGTKTGKLTHTYINAEKITIEDGIEYGDSIDLTPCNYILDKTELKTFDELITEEIEVQVYETV